MRPSASTERSREALGRAGAWVEAADTDNNIAEILSDQGRLDEAERLVRESLRTHRAAEYPMGIAYSIQHLGRIMARGGPHGGGTGPAHRGARPVGRDRQRGQHDRDRGEAGRGDAARRQPRRRPGGARPGDRTGAATRRRPVVAGAPPAAPRQRAGAGRRPRSRRRGSPRGGVPQPRQWLGSSSSRWASTRSHGSMPGRPKLLRPGTRRTRCSAGSG